MKIALASDHGGYLLKEQIKVYLKTMQHEVLDFGCFTNESCDYPDFIYKAAEAVAQNTAERAVVVCGSGVGASIVANKVPGVRCVLCSNAYVAEYSRLHNDANVIAFGERLTSFEEAKSYLELWLKTPYEGNRHQKRLEKIAALEKLQRGK